MIDSLGSKIQIHRIGPLKIGKIDFSRKPLKQEPCGKDINVPATDAISRQAVDELSKELVHTTRDKADFLCNFWEGLQKLPPVTPQPKTEVLDKIRAEVKALPNANPSYSGYSGYIDVVDREDVLEIIDKYKTESEEKK